MKRVLDYYAIREETLSPKAFIKLSPEKRANIARSEIVIPTEKASKHLAKFKVFYKRPIYKALT